MGPVSLIKTERYDLPQVQEAVRRHLDLLHFRIDPAAKVVVKPNLIMRCRPERTATTNPVVAEAVIRTIQGLGVSDITIADSPGGLYTPQVLAANYEQTGMKAVAERCGVKLNLSCGSRVVRYEEGQLCRAFDLIDPVADADVVINLCKLKTHCMTTLSCGIKNLFGCIPGLLKPQLHYRFPDGQQFARMLVDLSLLVKPSLTLVDAVDAMEGDGPTGGSRRHIGLTAAAVEDGLYSLDLVMAHLIGLGPEQVPMLADAAGRGLCPSRWEEVALVGDSDALSCAVADFAMPASKTLDFTGNVPRPLAGLIRRLEPRLAPRPQVREKDCIGCGRCAESCPAKTISLRNRKAKIDLSNCIHCFCCHEMCPVKAIDIKTTRIFRFLSKSRSRGNS